MKVMVAIIDRIESLAMPHTPCPLVQPDPKRLPNPTNKPPTITIRLLAVIVDAGIGL